MALNPMSTFPLPIISVTSIHKVNKETAKAILMLTAWVIWFEQGDLDALCGEVAQLLSQIHRGMIRRGMPYNVSGQICQPDRRHGVTSSSRR